MIFAVPPMYPSIFVVATIGKTVSGVSNTLADNDSQLRGIF